MIPQYPNFSEINLEMRGLLHPLFQSLNDGISEFTFANIYLFRNVHNYRISRIEDDQFVIRGEENGRCFIMLPFEIPERRILSDLLLTSTYIKAVTEIQAQSLSEMGYEIQEDRDNFDYIYLREELSHLEGRKYHRKKNLVNAFINNYSYEGKPLLEEYYKDVFLIINKWRDARTSDGDYAAAKEGVEMAELLSLCGGIYYVDGVPAAYNLGEEIGEGDTFVIHFEKAIGKYKGIYQFINMSFATVLPDKYVYINREQDLGNEGLRQAKMSYKPHAFVKKFKAFPKND
jgi:hypothetical protein